MSSVIIASIPVHGHVTPLLTIAANFVKRGDDVRFVTGSRFADSIAATGASHVPLPPEADFDDRNLFEAFPERARLKGIKAVAFDIENFFARPAKAQYDAIIATIAAQPADVVLAEPAFLERSSCSPISAPRVRRSSSVASFRSASRAATPPPSVSGCRPPAF